MGLTILQVALGGALGAVARHLSGIAAVRLLGSGFPYGTFAVNGIGCLAMGFAYMVLTGQQAEPARSAPFVITGFLGGYTTFSAFSLDFWQLVESGRIDAALAYAIGSVIVAVAALFVGVMAAKGLLG